MKLLDVERQDGRPVFKFMDLRQLSMSDIYFSEEQNIGRFLQNAKFLEKLHLSIIGGLSLVGILSTGACIDTLKVIDLTVPLYQYPDPPLAGLCEELEAMAGHNTLEVLSLEVLVVSHHSTEDSIGSTIQKVENILVKPGWSALRQVSFKLSVRRWGHDSEAELAEALQSLPDRYLIHLPKLESVAFNYSALYLA